ncbi:Protein dead ringer [Papilio xuthus]|uniref:Protein dead ringer n=1 Tax=Papilio xuthus TaxID=66420 RepID=A0A194QIL2_PAPXU|nr:Protein dead ringer [Papilio xuthus]
MAKSVLDLYELYNLVIARGGLVEVINKKLWQEIIKGLRLPSSITSAAFTLRTQYMKYLYDYECEKKNLSTRSELDAAIEGNKREGRRASGQYDAQAALAMGRLRHESTTSSTRSELDAAIEGNKREGRRASGQYDAQAALAMPSLNRGVSLSMPLTQPLALPLGAVPRLPMHAPHLHAHDIEYRVREYMKMIQQQRDLIRNGSESPPGNGGTMMSPREAALSAIDVSRLTLWSLYNNNNNNSPQPDLEPQREALNLSESPNSTASGGKREACRSPPPPAKRRTPRPPSPSPRDTPPRHPHPAHAPHAPHPAHPAHPAHGSHGPQAHTPHINGNANGLNNGVNGAAFKITTRGDANTGDQQLVVSIELNGVTYEGVLFPSQSNGQAAHRQMVS